MRYFFKLMTLILMVTVDAINGYMLVFRSGMVILLPILDPFDFMPALIILYSSQRFLHWFFLSGIFECLKFC